MLPSGRPRPTRNLAVLIREWWEADERPEPRSLGLLPSGSDPVGEWLVHRQPPASLSAERIENASARRRRSTCPVDTACNPGTPERAAPRVALLSCRATLR